MPKIRERDIFGRFLATHSMCHTKAYKTWEGMLRRTRNPRGKNAKNYYFRGIRVCKHWRKFENFFIDMGERPEGMTIERINNNKGYSKENCKWANRLDQARNRRTNRWITLNGSKKLLSDWAKELNINIQTLTERIDKHKWSIKKALTTPRIKKYLNKKYACL